MKIIIYQVPDVYKRPGYNEGINLILWIIGICVSVIFCYFYLKFANKHKSSNRDKARGFLVYGLFFLAVGLYRLLGIIGVIYAEYYNTLLSIAYIILLSICIVWINILEKDTFQRNRKIITYISSILFIMNLIFSLTNLINRYIAMILLTTFWGILANFMLICFIIIAKKETGIRRRKAITLSFGFVIVHLGLLFNAEFIMAWFPTELFFIPPILFLTGMIIFFLSNIANIKQKE